MPEGNLAPSKLKMAQAQAASRRMANIPKRVTLTTVTGIGILLVVAGGLSWWARR